MSTSDMPIPRTVTMDEAMAVLSDDPTAYNLPPDAGEEQVQRAKETAAANLVTGSAANAAYWNSRSELEQFVARAQGHGKVVSPPNAEDVPTVGAGPTAAGGVVTAGPTTQAAGQPTTVPGEVLNAPAGGEPAATAPAEPPDQSPEDRLRAQLRAANIEPEV